MAAVALLNTLVTGFGAISVNRLLAKLGNEAEPIAARTTIENKVMHCGTATNWLQLNFGFKRQIPDNLIHCISSLIHEPQVSYYSHDVFVKVLFASLSMANKSNFIGLPGRVAL